MKGRILCRSVSDFFRGRYAALFLLHLPLVPDLARLRDRSSVFIGAGSNSSAGGSWESCKPNSVPTRRVGGCHLSLRPIPGTRFTFANLARAAPRSPIWPCSRGGFPCPDDYASGGGLLPRRFTLTGHQLAPMAGGLHFLWHCLSESPCVDPARSQAGVISLRRFHRNDLLPVSAAPRPVEFGLSSS